VKELAITGLVCGFSGSLMLASLSFFRRKQGNWIVYGDLGTAYKLKGDDGEVQQTGFDARKADRLLRLTKWWSRCAFTLLALGFLLQLITLLTAN